MKWPRVVLLLLGIVGVCGSIDGAAAPAVPLAGRWRLNRDLSEFPKEVAFGIETTEGDAPPNGRQSGGGQAAGGRRGGGRSKTAGSGGGAGFSIQSVRESEEDVNKIKELIADAKDPSTLLTISQTDTAVIITDSKDRTRAFHPTGKEETEQLAAGPIGAISKWSGPQLSVQFTVRSDRIFRYVYSRLPGGQLLVETRLEEGRSREKAEVIRRVYDSE
jgi:hypothetical protein